MRRVLPVVVLACTILTPLLPVAVAEAATTGAVVTSVAGGGVVDGPATSATVYATSAAVGPDGTTYLADYLHNRVRAVTTDGMISTLAGTGDQVDGHGGFAGDGGAASAGQLNMPTAVAVSPAGDVFVLDRDNHRIRKISHADGTISTVAGNGGAGTPVATADATTQPMNPTDLALDPTTGVLAIADQTANLVFGLGTDGSLAVLVGGGATYPGDGGAPTAAKLSGPSSISYSPSGDLFVAEYFTGYVRRVHAGVIDTVVGGGTNAADGVTAVAAHLFAVDHIAAGPSSVFIGASGGSIYSFTVGGSLASVPNAPCGNAEGVTAAGQVIVTCGPAFAQQPDGTFTRLAGNRGAGINDDATPDGTPVAEAALQPVGGLLVSGTDILVSSRQTIDRIGADGLVHRVGGIDEPNYVSGDGGPATSAYINAASSLAPAPSGGLFASTGQNIKLITADGILHEYSGTTPVYSGVTEGQTAAQLNYANAITPSSSGDLYFGHGDLLGVIRWSDKTVHIINSHLSMIGGQKGTYYSEHIKATAMGSDGMLLVLSEEQVNGSFNASRVRRIDPATGTGTLIYAGPQLTALAAGPAGSAYVGKVLGQSALVMKLTAGGGLTLLAGGGHAVGATQSGTDLGLMSVDALAPTADGGLLIGSFQARRLLKLAPGYVATDLPPVTNATSSSTATEYGADLAFSWTPPIDAPSGATIEYAYRERGGTDLVTRTRYGSLPITATGTTVPFQTKGTQGTLSVYVITAEGEQSAPVTMTQVAAGDTTAPSPVDEHGVTSPDTTATFSWNASPNQDWDGVDIRMVAGTTAPAAASMPVYAGSGTSTTVTGLTVGQKYTYQYTTRDFSGNVTTGQVRTFTAGSPGFSLTGGPAQNGFSTANVTFGLTATDNTGTAPSCQLDGQYFSCYHFSPIQLNGLAVGRHTLSVGGRTNEGVGPAVTRTWTVDTTAPTVTLTAPAPFTLASVVAVSFKGTDGSAGIAAYNTRYRKAAATGGFGAFTAPAKTTATRANIPLVAGYTTCIQVQAVDKAGNASAWSPVKCTTRPLDDPSLTASSGWLRKRVAGYFGNTYSQTTMVNATLKKAATFRQLAVVVTTCSTCGSITVYSNSTALKSFSLKSSTTRKQVLLVLPVVSTRSATIVIKSTLTGKTVQIDGLGIARA